MGQPCNGAVATRVTPITNEMRLEVDLVGQNYACDCDLSSWQCAPKTRVPGLSAVTAVVRFHLTPYALPPPIVVMAYDLGKTPKYEPSAAATASVTPGLTYTVTVEILREDLQSASEYVAAIRIGDSGQPLLNLGPCNPDGTDYDCTFFDCGPQLGGWSNEAISYTPQTSTMAFEVDVVGREPACPLDPRAPLVIDWHPRCWPSRRLVGLRLRPSELDLLQGEHGGEPTGLHRRRALHSRCTGGASAAAAPAATDDVPDVPDVPD